MFTSTFRDLQDNKDKVEYRSNNLYRGLYFYDFGVRYGINFCNDKEEEIYMNQLCKICDEWKKKNK